MKFFLENQNILKNAIHIQTPTKLIININKNPHVYSVLFIVLKR